MPGPLGPFNVFEYTSDDGNVYYVGLNQSKGNAGGFTSDSSKIPNYPKAWRMRHVYGEQSDGTRISLPINSATDGLFVAGGGFSVHGQSYTVRGRVGEKRPS